MSSGSGSRGSGPTGRARRPRSGLGDFFAGRTKATQSKVSQSQPQHRQAQSQYQNPQGQYAHSQPQQADYLASQYGQDRYQQPQHQEAQHSGAQHSGAQYPGAQYPGAQYPQSPYESQYQQSPYSQPQYAQSPYAQPYQGSDHSAQAPVGAPAEHTGPAPWEARWEEFDPMVDPGYDADDRNWIRYRPAWGGFVRLLVFGLVLLVAILWMRSRIYGWVDAQITPAGPAGAPVELTIASGSSLNDIAGDLHSAGVISNATVFRYWLRCEGNLTLTGFLGCDSVTNVAAGDYLLYENMSFEAVQSVLASGPAPEAYELVTIPEGLRWSAMADRLIAENPAFDRTELEAAYLALVSEADYLPDDAPVRTLEGMLFPATYDITDEGLSDEYGFLLRMSNEFDSRLGSLLANPGLTDELVQLGIGPYEVIVVASLVEEEALIAEERPMIARVIYNRIASGERLDIDATACYAANKPCAELTRADVDRESPWNTRVVRGLPPTPISAPGEASLRAALSPADGDWMFYVRTDEGGVVGAHHFHRTLEEHNQHVQTCRELGYC